MVLGIRSKNKKGHSSVQLDYQINVLEIKPWPPSHSQSLRSGNEFVLLQWQNGDQCSGSLTSTFVGDGKVEFSDPFRLLVTLSRKQGSSSFQKNCLAFYLYEPKKDKAMKGQLLGSAVINFADYGDIQESVVISEAINLKKSSKNTAQPVLYVNIQPFGRDSNSMDQDGNESISTLQNEGDDVESEILSFTDDDNDVSSNSSQAVSSSSAWENARGSSGDNDKNVSESLKDGTGTETVKGEPQSLGMARPVPEVKILAEAFEPPSRSSSSLSSTELSTSSVHPINDLGAQLASTSDSYTSAGMHSNHGSRGASETNQENNSKAWRSNKNVREEVTASKLDIVILEEKDKERQKLGQDEAKKSLLEEKSIYKLPQDTVKKEVYLKSHSLAFGRSSHGVQGRAAASHKLKHLMSVQSNFDSLQSNGISGNSHFVKKEKEIDSPENALTSVQSNFNSYMSNEISSNSHSLQKEKENDTHENTQNSAVSCALNEGTVLEFSGEKVKLESKIGILEEELRETAAVEVSLYSIVAEHTSSTIKVHAPARRLSRFYLYACKSRTLAKRASAARAAVSGLVLVSKACGSDVPRLTFWLSNSIGLRTIVSQAVQKLQLSAKAHGYNDDWEDPQTFLVALEKFEAWIFSRIVESVWWQALTPHMQPAAAKSSSSRKGHGRRYGLGGQDQGNFSVELWKKAFKDSCERLCPIRAAGHECGCLPVMAKLVMEQLVSRLDVAMFNAILRESAEEMPTDPVSDPISDSKVLPIPAGKSSFGAGAQLKNAVGNWSRWLTDLFGIDDNDSPEDENELDGEKRVESNASFRAFPLLKALSDLMMLPLEMLADRSTRKEVCPTFGASVVKRVLENFVPDEFSPDPIPEEVFDALDSEDLTEANAEESITSIPCIATPTVYSPPPAASLVGLIGEVASQPLQKSASAVLRKSYTSDDELEELDSPINLIFTDNSRVSSTSAASNWVPEGNGGRKVVRYQLLREVWKDGE